MTFFGIDLAQAALAFGVASLVTALELITSKYPQTYTFVLQSRWFYLYVAIYGLLGAAALALLPFLTDHVNDKAGVLSDPWLRAGLIGLGIKAILHIRIFTVTPGPGQSFPVGLETFVQLFEPWMTRQIEIDHYGRVADFIKPRVKKYSSVVKARNLAKSSIPSTFNDKEKAALLEDIKHARNSSEVISDYLKYVGVGLTKRTFPA